MKNSLSGDALRFLIAGGLNTLISFCLYQFLLLFLSHNLSYTICWIAGIVFIAIFYPSKVFPDNGKTKKHTIAVIVSYLIIFAVSLWSLDQLVTSGINARFAVLATLILSSTLNFIAMRFIFRGHLK